MTSYGSRENVPPRPPTTGSTRARGPLLLYFETHGCVDSEAISPICCSHQVTEGDRALGPFLGAHGIPLLANFGLKVPQWPCRWYWFGILGCFYPTSLPLSSLRLRLARQSVGSQPLHAPFCVNRVLLFSAF